MQVGRKSCIDPEYQVSIGKDSMYFHNMYDILLDTMDPSS